MTTSVIKVYGLSHQLLILFVVKLYYSQHKQYVHIVSNGKSNECLFNGIHEHSVIIDKIRINRSHRLIVEFFLPSTATKDVLRCAGFLEGKYSNQNWVYKPASLSRSRIAEAAVAVAPARDSRRGTWRWDRARRKDSWTFRAVDTCTRKANVSTAADRSIGWAPWTRTTIICDWSRFTRSSPSGGWACDATVWNPSDRTWWWSFLLIFVLGS